MFDVVDVVRGLLPGDPAAADPDQLLDEIVTAQWLINALNGAQLDRVAEFATRRLGPGPDVPGGPGGERRGRGGVSEFASAELGSALTLSRRAADLLLSTALDLADLPRSAAALRAGELDLRRFRVIGDAVIGVPPAAVAAVETRLHPRASTQTAPQLRRAARRAVLAACPATEQERQHTTYDQRAAWTEHDGDGRSRLIAQGPTHTILRLHAALTAIANTPHQNTAGGTRPAAPPPGGTRPAAPPPGGTPVGGGPTGASGDRPHIDQRRFDALDAIADRILDDPALPGTRHGPPGLILLADLATLAQLETGRARHPFDQPDRPHQFDPAGHPGEGAGRLAELAGDGPISDPLTAELLGHRHTTLISTDPDPPHWTCQHTQGYEPPDRLSRHIRARHTRCAFPGCAIPAHRCDVDHVIPWPTGPTCACNLLPLCRYHHRLKTHTRWQLTLRPDRTAEWTSPTGRTYTTHPHTEGATAAAATAAPVADATATATAAAATAAPVADASAA